MYVHFVVCVFVFVYTSDKMVSRPNQRGISVQGIVYTKVDKKEIYVLKTNLLGSALHRLKGNVKMHLKVGAHL